MTTPATYTRFDIRQITEAQAREAGYAGAREYLEAYCALYDANMTGFPLVATTGDSAMDFLNNEDFWMAVYERPVGLYAIWMVRE